MDRAATNICNLFIKIMKAVTPGLHFHFVWMSILLEGHDGDPSILESQYLQAEYLKD